MVGIRVAIVDDHALVAGAVRELLMNAGDVEVVGTAETAAAGLALVIEQSPDIAILDLHLPDAHGLGLIEDIRVKAPETKILVVTVSDDSMTVGQAVDRGIHGYVTKGSRSEHLVVAVRAAFAGGLYFDEAARRALESWAADPYRLTEDEKRMLQMLQQGQGHDQIAGTLKVSKATLKRHLHTIAERLGAKNSADAASEASRRGLI